MSVTITRETIAIVGSGFIGRAWAMVFARSGARVRLYDAHADALEQAERLLDTNLADLEGNDLITSAREVRARIKAEPDLEAALDGVTWVQENAPERLELKRPLFELMDAAAPADAVLASSTSAIPAADIFAGLAGERRMLVAHPANPPYLLPIVELSASPGTDPSTVARARALMEAAGMAPIEVLKPAKGFILNRLQVALLNEAFKLVRDGYVSAADLDKTIKHGLGLRWAIMGPFETIDLNAPGGIRDYLERYGPAFQEIVTEQEENRPWDTAMLDALEQGRREELAPEDLPKRQVWRDRRLMALARHKHAAARDIGE